MRDINILVVEDERIVSEDIKRRLISLGYKVLDTVSSGERAIEIAESNKPDLILMDIMLEGDSDGIETAERIKNLYAIPVVFLTAHTDERTIQRAKVAEPYGYLLKPFEIRDLRSTLEIALYKAEVQRKLKESQQWLNTVLNSIGEAVIAVDSEDKVKFINPVAEKLTGQAASIAAGKPLDEVYKVINEISDENLILCCLAENDNISLENLLNSKMLISGNQTIPIEETYSEIKDSRNQVTGKVITFRDISRRRAFESAIIASRNYYLSLFEEFPALIWRSRPDGKFNYFNRTWLEFSGRNIEDEIEYGWLKFVHENDRADFRELFESSIKKKERFECELRILNRENEYRWIMCFGSPFIDLSGNYSGYIGACYDITPRKIMEEQLEQARIKAEASSRAKSTFLSNMSHEIRTPMNGIIGITEVLIDTNLNAEQKNYLSMLRKSAFSLLNLLNSILDYSKYEAGKLKLDNSNFDLKLLLDEVVRIFIPETNIKGVELSCKIDNRIPSTLAGDAQRLKQILVNLMSNAVKFTEKGTISIEVSRSYDLEDEDYKSAGADYIPLHFVIRDTGIGIEESKHEMVFESFTQADSSSTKKYGGTGLGLSIAKQLVEMMKGRIWFESSVGEGTTFYIEFTFSQN